MSIRRAVKVIAASIIDPTGGMEYVGKRWLLGITHESFLPQYEIHYPVNEISMSRTYLVIGFTEFLCTFNPRAATN